MGKVADSVETNLQNNNMVSEPQGIPEGIINLSNHPYLSPYVFVVDKQKRNLSVYRTEKESEILQVQSFPTDIGKRNGPKLKANDYKTPEGIYFLQNEMHPPEISFDLYGSRAFTTDYPNIFDIRQSKSGNGIWLHAIPDSVALTRGSRGCVVVRDHAIKEISNWIKLKQTPMMIFDKVSFVSRNQFDARKSEYLNKFESWRKAWENQDVDAYIRFYDSSFKSAKMDFSKWYNHKSRLKKLYKYIKVQLSPPTILKNGNQVVIRTLQKYESDLHSDYGEKTLHAYWDETSGFRIIREDWKPLVEEDFNREMARH